MNISIAGNDSALLEIIRKSSNHAFLSAKKALSLMDESLKTRLLANGDDGLHSAMLISSGGKRLRPLLVSLSAEACGTGTGENTLRFMSAVELTHMASLVHDDIVDRSRLRRGEPTLWTLIGDYAAARCGIEMMALASEIMSECENTPDEALSVLADIPLKMCLGELKQLEIARDETRQTRDDYMKRISQKTAALIEGSCLLGGIAAGADAKTKKALSAYGHATGLIFQLRDDLLDLELFPSDGKPVSQDAGRGYYTLPLLHALNLTSAASPSGKRLRALLRKRVHSVEDGAEIARLAKAAGGVRHTRQTMKREEAKALKALTLIPQNDGSTALKALTLALAADADADQ